MTGQKIIYLSFFCCLLLTVLLCGLNFPATKDEPFYYATITNFPQIYSSHDSIKSYILPCQANDLDRVIPLPGYFAMQFILGKIIGYQTWKMRLLNVLFCWLAIAVFLKIATELNRRKTKAAVAAFFLFLNPYFFMSSFLIYTDIPALCFALLAMYFYIKQQHIISTVFLMLCIFTRQIYIFLPVSFVLTDFFQQKRIFSEPKRLLYVVPLLAIIIALYALKTDFLIGVHFPLRSFRVPSLNRLILSVGIYTLPILLLSIKTFFRKDNLKKVLFFLPLFFIDVIFYKALFILRTDLLTGILGKLPPTLLNICLRYTVVTIMWFLGALVLSEIFGSFRKDPERAIFYWQIIVVFVTALFLRHFWAKYIIMILPAILIVLLAKNSIPNKAIAYIFIFLMFIMNIAGFYFFVVR